MHHFFKILLLMMVCLPLSSACHSRDAADLDVRDAWIRPMPPGSGMTAVYFTLVNGSDKQITLVAVASEVFASTSMHETIITDGVSRMRHRQRVVIPAHAQIHFQPGGLHVMLSLPDDFVSSAKNYVFELKFAEIESVKITAGIGDPVRPRN